MAFREPGNEDDDSCNEEILNNCLLTDANGRAFYDFVGGSMGTATITAVVYEPVVDGGARIRTVGPDTVVFGAGQDPIVAKLSGKSKGGNEDKTRVSRAAESPGYRSAEEMVYDAIQGRSTDIHMEPTDEQMGLRVRIDGVHMYRPRTDAWEAAPR